MGSGPVMAASGVRLGLIASQLDAEVAKAAELPPAAAALLAPQLRSHTDASSTVDQIVTKPHAAVGEDGYSDTADGGLPSLESLCRELGLPVQRTRSVTSANTGGGGGGATAAATAGERLPQRVRSGAATDLERTLWKTWYRCGVHEVMSAELVDGLAGHVRSVLATCTPTATPTAAAEPPLPVVLELGAGSGLLAEQLARRLAGTAEVVAVDDFTAGISQNTFGVHRIDAADALRRWSPAVVLVAWMPSGIDWTRQIRACGSVKQYVLLGEADSSTCGDGWATWGVLPIAGCRRCQYEGCARCDYGLDEDSVPPFRAQGFARVDLGPISDVQICRFDSAAVRGFSSAVAFTKVDG